MTIEISHETEARLIGEAQKQGISVEALLECLLSERGSPPHIAADGSSRKVPILHLGAMGSLHRRDIYDDVR